MRPWARGGVSCWQIAQHLPHPLALAFEAVWQAGPVQPLVVTDVLARLRDEQHRRAVSCVEPPASLRQLLGELMRRVRAAEPGTRADCLHRILDAALEPTRPVWLDSAGDFVCLLHREGVNDLAPDEVPHGG